MKAEIESLTVSAPAATIARLQTASGDLSAVGRIKTLKWSNSPTAVNVKVALAELLSQRAPQNLDSQR